MKDGTYVVKEVVKGKRKNEFKVILKGQPKTDVIWTIDTSIRKGSTVTVKRERIIAVKNT